MGLKFPEFGLEAPEMTGRTGVASPRARVRVCLCACAHAHKFRRRSDVGRPAENHWQTYGQTWGKPVGKPGANLGKPVQFWGKPARGRP